MIYSQFYFLKKLIKNNKYIIGFAYEFAEEYLLIPFYMTSDFSVTIFFFFYSQVSLSNLKVIL